MLSEDPLRLARVALWGLKRTDSPDFAYQKADVALLDLSTIGTSQRDLFAKAWRNICLMMMDRISGI